MSTPSPLIPQGAFPPNRGRSHIRIAVFTILAVHVVLLGALLMAGCKKTTDGADGAGTNAYIETPPQEQTNNYAQQSSQIVPPPPPPAYVEPTTSSPPPAIITPPTPTTSVAVPNNNLINNGATPNVGLGPNEHVIIKGESFYTIAKKYGVTSKAIADANPGVDATRLKIGQKINVPAPTLTAAAPSSGPTPMGGDSANLYVVKSGDTLMKIAKVHGVTVKSLRSANSLRTDQIKVGQKLKIPAKNGAPAPDQMATSPPPASGAAPPPPQ